MPHSDIDQTISKCAEEIDEAIYAQFGVARGESRFNAEEILRKHFAAPAPEQTEVTDDDCPKGCDFYYDDECVQHRKWQKSDQPPPGWPAPEQKDGLLTFAELRRMNLLRLPLFKDRQGRFCHDAKADPIGSDWALSQWCNAVTGELGEAANIIKKIERGDFSLDEARGELGRELADVQTYLDLLAHRAGVNLGVATIQKWNEISERIGCDLRLYSEPAVEPSEE